MNRTASFGRQVPFLERRFGHTSLSLLSGKTSVSASPILSTTAKRASTPPISVAWRRTSAHSRPPRESGLFIRGCSSQPSSSLKEKTTKKVDGNYIKTLGIIATAAVVGGIVLNKVINIEIHESFNTDNKTPPPEKKN